MRKTVILLLLIVSLLLGTFGFAEDVDKIVADAVVIPAADASFVADGQGVSIENEKADTVFDAEHGFIVNIAPDAEITYTVPDGVDGVFDVYLTVSKIMAQFTSQPFCYSINGGELFSVPVDCEVFADSVAADNMDGSEDNTGEWYDDGRFLIAENVALKSGDTVKLIASYGARAPMLKGLVFPGVGELTLAPAGAQVATGYDYSVKLPVELDPEDPLSGLDLIWIGSSVTYGAHASGHYSMVDAIQDNHPGTICEKYAISATTLVNQSDESYVARLKRIPKDKQPDLVIVQLSTNDATTGKEFGEIAEGFDAAEFDDTTIAGAIETIIAYAQETFGCRVVFYTGTYIEKEGYAEMVELLHAIQEKWGIGVIDMFNNDDMTALYGTEQYNSYMFDEVHPNKLGYVEWWTPVIEQGLAEYVIQR